MYEQNLSKSELFDRWVTPIYYEDTLKEWESKIISDPEPDPEANDNILTGLQWGLGLLGLCLNLLTAYLFYRGHRIRGVVLGLSFAVYGLSICGLLFGLNIFIFMGASGLWFGIAFPFSLMHFIAQPIMGFLSSKIEFVLFVFITVMGPVSVLALVGSYLTWTRFSPWLAQKMQTRK